MDNKVSFLFYLYIVLIKLSAQIVSVGNFNFPTSRDLHQPLQFAYATPDLALATKPSAKSDLSAPVEQMAYSGWLKETRTSALETNSSHQVANNNSLQQLQLNRQVNT